MKSQVEPSGGVKPNLKTFPLTVVTLGGLEPLVLCILKAISLISCPIAFSAFHAMETKIAMEDSKVSMISTISKVLFTAPRVTLQNSVHFNKMSTEPPILNEAPPILNETFNNYKS